MKMKRAVSMGLKPSVFAVASATPYTGQNASKSPDGEPRKPGRNTAPVSLAGTANNGAGKVGSASRSAPDDDAQDRRNKKPDAEERFEAKPDMKNERKEAALEKKAKK